MKSKIALKPNQTIVFIGDSITDAERMSAAYKPFGAGYVHFTENDLSGAADLDEYDSMYRRLISQTKKESNSRIVIIEPFMFCDDLNNPVFVELRRFVEKVRTIAVDFDAVLVPLQGSIDEQIGQVPPQNWSLDMVHPEIWAHAWISQRWLEATGL
ncbi:MAG: hypothetical protein NTW55_04555 [Planctomycetota bacterium]|nr:hypothetical protein [Planctomycetota bacterium]